MKKYKYNFSITTGLLINLLGVIVITSCIFMASIYIVLAKYSETTLTKKTKEYFKYLENSIQRPLWLYDFETLAQTADNFFKSSPVSQLQILDAVENKVLYENYYGEIEDTVSYADKIYYKGEFIGFIRLGISKAEYMDTINKILYSSGLAIFVITLGLVFFIFVFISSFLRKPLMSLLEGIKAIKGGNYRYLFPSFSNKEFNLISSAFHEMKEEINKRETALRESEEKFRKLANATSAGIMVYQNNKWIFANPAAELITGYSIEELVNMFIWDIVSAEYKDIVKETGRKRQGNIRVDAGYEIEILSRDGTKRWVYIEGNTIEYMGRLSGIVSIIDVTERKQAESMLNQAWEYVDSIINYMPSVLISVDSQLKVKHWNKKAESRTGISRIKAMGKSLTELLRPSSLDSYVIKEAIEGKQIKELSKRPTTVNGEVIYEDITIYPISGNNIDGAVVRVDDVTYKVKLDQALIEAEAVKRSSRAKSAFLANMSHELVTPLNGIIAIPDVLMSDELPEENYNYLKMIKDNGLRLLSTIKDILYFSELDSGQTKKTNKLFDLYLFYNEISEKLKINAEPKKIAVLGSFDPQLPHRLVGDSAILEKILTKLGDNGVKFTNKNGTIKLIFSLERETNTDVDIKFCIKDSGIGVEQNKLDVLFNSFEQVDGSYTRPYEGLGLGLTIAKLLTELLGGVIGAESKIGEGSDFWVVIPFKKVLLT